MFEFHSDRFRYFLTQRKNTEKYVIPFIRESGLKMKQGDKVLEVGCGEGGVLLAFVNTGCIGTGVELDALRFNQAREFLKEEINSQKISLYHCDIYDEALVTHFKGHFDLIILKDVIEHIRDQEKLLRLLRTFLTAKGLIFVGFPPWRMPFGGHQQVCKHRVLSKLPWIHLLPDSLYKKLLKLAGEDPSFFIETKETRISINGFEKVAVKAGFALTSSRHFLINPIYEYKFHISPRVQYRLIESVPHVRDFFTTCVYYTIQAIDTDEHTRFSGTDQ